MTATAERREQDLAKLEALCGQSQGRIRVINKTGNPVREVVVELAYRTAPSSHYPSRVQDKTQVKVKLSDRYPFQEPTAVILTPILHPNVFTSGQICLGKNWIPTENLALLIRRIALIITFDPTVLNEQSPANSAALNWYRSARAQNPSAFPTDRVAFSEATGTSSKRMEWKDLSDAQAAKERVEVLCPHCQARLRVPPGRRGHVKCSVCSAMFPAQT